MLSTERDRSRRKLIDRGADRYRRPVRVREVVMDYVDASISTRRERADQRSQRQPGGSRRHTAERFRGAAFSVDFSSQTAEHNIRFRVRRVMRPDK